MKINKYLTMNSDELYSHLITDVMADPHNGKFLIRKLSRTELYKNDFEFRLSVDTAKAILHGMSGENTQLLSLCTDLIERAEALHMWQLLSTNLNLLGTAYAALGVYERALECYFNVIRNEKKHDLIAMTSIAHNNIAILYTNFNEKEKIYKHCILAIETLEKGGRDQPRYQSKMVLYLCNLIKILSEMDKLEEAPKNIEKIHQIGLNNVTEDVLQAFYFSMMHYHFHLGDFEEARSYYFKLRNSIGPDNLDHNLAALGNFIEQCKQNHLDYTYYLDEMLYFEKIEKSDRALLNIQVYKELRNYYKTIGNRKRFHEIGDSYIDFLEEELNTIRECQGKSLCIVEDIICESEEIKEVITKNTELKLVAAEAIKHKNSLQEAYQRIEMINELGRNLTSSLNLEKVIEGIYKNISENLPVSAFILMIVDEDKNQLRTAAYYDNDVLQPEVCLDLQKDQGLFIEAYKTNRTITTMDKEHIKFFEEQKNKQPSATMKSAIYIPLSVGESVIGLCSVQDKQKNVYTEEHLKFLEELKPYLSIALNNAVRSGKLKNEIESHLETQKKLQKANSKLKKISSLDGLTQISSRRDFDSRIINMLKEAKSNNTTICVFMLDIDKFKQYNDTYGHLEGDEALKTVAKVFRRNMEKVNGLSARFGGEEFIGACSGLDKRTCVRLAEKIKDDIYRLNIEHRSYEIGRLTVSIGIALTNAPLELKKSEMMKCADKALYKAKETGRNKIVLNMI